MKTNQISFKRAISVNFIHPNSSASLKETKSKAGLLGLMLKNGQERTEDENYLALRMQDVFELNQDSFKEIKVREKDKRVYLCTDEDCNSSEFDPDKDNDTSHLICHFNNSGEISSINLYRDKDPDKLKSYKEQGLTCHTYHSETIKPYKKPSLDITI